MQIEKIYLMLVNASRPIEVFGEGGMTHVKKEYRRLAKLVHPDLLNAEDKNLGEKVMHLLNEFYKLANKEIADEIYNIYDEKKLYSKKEVIIDFKIKANEYKFYEYINQDDITDIYKGLVNDELIYLRITLDEEDNNLLEDEYKLLNTLKHHGIPKVNKKLNINGLTSVIYKDFTGIPFTEVIKQYGYFNGNHIMWFLERMLSIIGYLHSNYVVHGNIKPGNIYINVDMHNVILLDYTLSIQNATEEDSKYKIINDGYSPKDIDIKSKVLPNNDIYAVGKLAIELLGGNILNNGMPINLDIKIRNFIRKLVQEDSNLRNNNAYELWDELINIRNEIYGNKRFVKLNKKERGGN